MPESAGTAYITILPDTDRFVATLVAQMQIAGTAVKSSGRDAFDASASYRMVGEAMGDAGRDAAVSAAGYVALGEGADYAKNEVQNLDSAIARSTLMRSGGFFGGPPGRGIATDLGSVFREFSNLAQGALGFLTLVSPTINLIIAGLVGVVALLGAAVVAAAAFAAALAATAVAMGFAAFKWRDLLLEGQKGAETWRGALIAVETQAFNMAQGVAKSFEAMSSSGKDLWTSIGELGVKALRAMQPVVDWLVDHVSNLVDALNGVAGASSGWLDFLRTWIDEWKVLAGIVNAGLPGGEGFLGFLEKYEKPAKAFVEGIAQMINAVRKMSSMGLGLNMDQLAEFIRNVFTALSSLIVSFPKFSNALVSVGLEVTRFINRIMPIISTSIDIGAAILQHIVAPLVNGFLRVVQGILETPIIGFLAELAGGFGLVAVAVSKLSFGLIGTGAAVRGLWAAFLFLSRGVGLLVLPTLTKLGVVMGSLGVTMTGSIIILAAITAAYFLLKGATDEVGEAQARVNEVFKAGIANMHAGSESILQVAQETQNAAAAAYEGLSFLGKGVFLAKNFGTVLTEGLNAPTVITVEETLSKIRDEMTDIVDTASQEITGGFLSKGTVLNLQELRDTAGDLATVDLSPLEGLDLSPTLQVQVDAAKDYQQVLADIDYAYQNEIITAGQYATMLEQLKTTVNSVGEEMDLTALKVKGAALSIAEGFIQVQEAGGYATGAITAFGQALGEDVVSFRQDAVAAFTDIAGGITGTGAKVTEWIQDQVNAIASWKAAMTENVNLVGAVWQGLGTTVNLTADKIVSALDKALSALIDFRRNFNTVQDLGLSKLVTEQLAALPGEQMAKIYAALSDATPKQIERINTAAKKGIDIAGSLAGSIADAIGLTMQKLLGAIEILVSDILGVSVEEVDRRVNKLVDDTGRRVDRLDGKKIKIDVITRYKMDKVRSDAGLGGKAPAGGESGLPGFPTPNPAAIHKTWAAVAQNAISGAADGMKNDSAAVAAAKQLGDHMVKATSQAIGAASPAKKFIAIGRDAVDGLIKGVSQATGTLTAQMTRAGNAMATGLRNGLINGLQGVKEQAVSTVQELVNAVNQVLQNASPSKVFYRIGTNIAEGMRLGIRDGMGDVHREISFDHMGGRIGVPARRISGRDGGNSMYGEMRIRDWRSGLASLEGELEWNESVAYR